jgi:prepilin-type N-terminal cleavage/methylation domain-containing protein
MNLHNKTHSRGFTLIELLVVISIIGLLSSIVLASLNGARKKAQEAVIKSDLKNFMPQAELVRSDVGDYSTVDSSSFAMQAGITKVGGKVACYSTNQSDAGDYLRWGCSATNSDNTKNWSVSSQGGVVIWDDSNLGSYNWDNAVTACATAGGRLPTIEELKALRSAYGTIPTGFINGFYWSSTESVLSTDVAWRIMLGSGSIIGGPKSSLFLVRCVR